MNTPILVSTDHICLFCGNVMPKRYEEYTSYFECDCPDAVKDREINKKILELGRSRPKHRYEITTELVLHKLEDNEENN